MLRTCMFQQPSAYSATCAMGCVPGCGCLQRVLWLIREAMHLAADGVVLLCCVAVHMYAVLVRCSSTGRPAPGG